MLKISIQTPTVIVFIDADDNQTCTITGPPSNWICPRPGDQFEFDRKGRTNVVTDIYHELKTNTVFVYYDYYDAYVINTILQVQDFDRNKIPNDIV